MAVNRILIEEVLKARMLAEAAVVRIRTAREVFNVENADLLTADREAQEALGAASQRLREAMLADFAETGDPASGPGCKIRVIKNLHYYDKKALEWAIEHKMALKLDGHEFERMVKASPGAFTFVEITQEPQATIAQDLAAALDKAGVPS